MFIGKPDIKEPIALALGVFDGIHKGHLAVISLAEQNPYGAASAVASFVPHPKKVLSGKSVDSILTEEERVDLLKQVGVKYSIVFDFLAVMNMEPEVFFHKLIAQLPIKMLCCGYNFHFGKDGKGDVTLLKELCKEQGIHFAVASAVKVDDCIVSSSAIREYVENGEIEKAGTMLGRPLIFDLLVDDGDHRGRTIGFPTINQQLPECMIKPKFGVYASSVLVENQWRPAVTNIGIRPTYLVQKPLFETYIIGYSGDLYGQKVKLRLKKFIRGESKFSSLNELKKAIEKDLNTALTVDCE